MTRDEFAKELHELMQRAQQDQTYLVDVWSVFHAQLKLAEMTMEWEFFKYLEKFEASNHE